jgi:steroid delta-isomerase-like uncharacterized protein
LRCTYLLRSRRSEVAHEILAEDFVFYGPPAGIRGPEAFAGFVRMMHSAFPDFRLETHEIIADGAKAARFCTMHGTHQGELRGIAPSGRSVARPRSDTFRIEDGKIREVQAYLDHKALFASLQSEPQPSRSVR